ncbi:retron system putative HNH endonuclease [Vibrio parahaemolyticus]
MRQITKGRQPNSLVQYKRQQDATYNNLPQNVRNDLKSSLLQEQGYVCAYCMKRISTDKMRVEHWASQQDNEALQLEYSNLLACCQGNEGQGIHKETCDVKKKNQALKYSPTKAAHNINQKVRFLGNGKIDSTDVVFNEQLKSVLNLNETRLVENRNAALEVLCTKLGEIRGTRTKTQLRDWLGKVLSRNSKNQQKEYFGYLAAYLEKKIG